MIVFLLFPTAALCEESSATSQALQEFFKRQQSRGEKPFGEKGSEKSSDVNLGQGAKKVSGKLKSMEQEIGLKNEKSIYGYSWDIFVRPFELSKISKLQNITIGTDIMDKDPKIKKFGYEGHFKANRQKRVDIYSNNKISFTNFDGSAQFFYNDILGKADYFAFIGGEREKEGGLKLIHYRILAGITGLKIDFIKSKNIQEFSFGYIPLFEQRHFDKITDKSDPNNIATSRVVDNFIRHSFRLSIRMLLWERVIFRSLAMWQPKHDLKTKDFDAEDSDSKVTADFVIKVIKNLSFAYTTEFLYNVAREKLHQRSSTDLHQAFSLGYTIDL
jgi:hypothetical protein